ncbi:hypothetical protein NDU88_005984 [Pleurodeles waltl]|uniref:Uncharacterized protein n=1 Tax=Pleurodeles waltl TaxID=8319 RepID=A0AAV7MXW7_PLEWA|nr:hypothetical protein NDU88_005984 [Pleurodeles waltl]
MRPQAPSKRRTSRALGLGDKAYMDGKFEALLAAIDSSGESMEGKIDSLSVELGLICEDSWKLSARVHSLESTLQSLIPTVQSGEHSITTLEAQTRGLAVSLDDKEGHEL